VVQELNQRYRQVSPFGNGVIRRFTGNASAMRKLAARDFEDLLQVSTYSSAIDTTIYTLHIVRVACVRGTTVHAESEHTDEQSPIRPCNLARVCETQTTHGYDT
jgi:hypothetical protein